MVLGWFMDMFGMVSVWLWNVFASGFGALPLCFLCDFCVVGCCVLQVPQFAADVGMVGILDRVVVLGMAFSTSIAR